MSPNSKPSLVDTKLPTFAVPPASPQSPRKLRKFQSHQSLTSTSFSSFGQPLATTATAGNNGNGNRQRDSASNGASTEIQSDTNVRPRTRGRSNSESGSGNPTPLTTGTVRTKRPARKTDSSGYSVKRSGLDALLRDGPADGRLMETLQELRLMVLSNRVDADSDGMSTYRIYLWLALLGVSPLLTDEYLALVHRGRSPAYTKIRNDTSRTLATDPLFKRRVTEASLIRLLNAVAWKLHDAQQVTKPSSRPSSRRKELLELTIDSPPTITEEPEGDSVQPIDNPTSKPAIYVQGMNVLCV